jgi:hypothetical protein
VERFDPNPAREFWPGNSGLVTCFIPSPSRVAPPRDGDAVACRQLSTVNPRTAKLVVNAVYHRTTIFHTAEEALSFRALTICGSDECFKYSYE